MAGIDNSDDKHVRDQIKVDQQLGSHRAHRHFPNWQDTKTVSGQEWAIAGPGVQLSHPPETPMNFWVHCMECLNETLGELGLDIPDEQQLLANHMSEAAFRDMQKTLIPGKQSGPAI